ncbi:CaiB/BaiF CoA transferase family protein [Biformimicrobium ophioploci]|uniref:CaiB/BaiF CoA-transferase family protein n=1 Tax=Biformimicrobium ophioploci TaxID=3036711 RepID=A0ABQ6LW56_9GAMM|nr:CoA transferase [Microbulbifer sp. NKW57]GMG86336.1 CaiB/BaiF CoA-transferase family protein [Microbulbifer sp. NKW57]
MKLQGIRVVDLSLFLPGPHLTMMMADHGAEVIKVEPPSGEPTREIGLRHNGQSVWFRNTHRGKRSLCLNLKDESQKAQLLELIDNADVFVEGFRPGAMARLGLDYETLRARNPRLVYCSISAYGQTGPKCLKPAHDLSIQADSGTVFLNEGMDGKPCSPALPAADMTASLMALSGILMALLRRTETGQGDYLDISMQDSLVAWLPNAMGPVFAEDRSPEVKQERSWGGNAMYRIYQTADGRYLTLGGSELKFAQNLFARLGQPELADICRQPPGQQHEAIAFLERAFAERSLAEWESWFEGLDVCWSPVRLLHEALEDDHLQSRQMVFVDGEGNRHLGVPIKFQREPAVVDTRLPELGEHNAQYLSSGEPA